MKTTIVQPSASTTAFHLAPPCHASSFGFILVAFQCHKKKVRWEEQMSWWANVMSKCHDDIIEVGTIVSFHSFWYCHSTKLSHLSDLVMWFCWQDSKSVNPLIHVQVEAKSMKLSLYFHQRTFERLFVRPSALAHPEYQNQIGLPAAANSQQQGRAWNRTNSQF